MTLTRKGWNSLKPITAPEQMSTPIHWNPMSDDWKRWIDSHQVYNGESRFSKEMLDAMKALHDKILGFGGDEVCMTAYDEDAVKTLSRGLYAQGSAQSMSREFRLSLGCKPWSLLYCDRVRSFRGRALALSFLGRTAPEPHNACLGNDR